MLGLVVEQQSTRVGEDERAPFARGLATRGDLKVCAIFLIVFFYNYFKFLNNFFIKFLFYFFLKINNNGHGGRSQDEREGLKKNKK